MTKYGPTKAAAERALRLALRDRSGPTGGDITADTRVRDLVTLWLATVDSGNLADRTKELYRDVTTRYVLPGIGGLRVAEVSVPTLDRLLSTITERHGAGSAKTSRSVLSSVLGLAVRHGALPTNPVRDAGKLSQPRKSVRSLTLEDARALLDRIRADERAVELDLSDLVEFLLGTGLRIGEALALRPQAIDHDTHQLQVNGTVIRTKGQGVRIQDRPKTQAGWRLIAVPTYIDDLVRRREALPAVRAAGVIFPSPLGHVRDPSNTSADLRRAFDRAGFDWVSSHTFRKTVATRLDDAGLSARQIADHLGHARPSITQDVYMGRNVASTKAANVLQELQN